MAVVITINSNPGNLLQAPIGTALALSEQGGFAGSISSVLWELTRPVESQAALTTVAAILIAPFDNGFTPDVPGRYRLRLVVTNADGSTEEDTAIVQVEHPAGVGFESPAPLEEREHDATTGWADDANFAIQAVLYRLGGRDAIVVKNTHGAAIPADRVVGIESVVDWPTETGGSAVPGAPVDYLPQAKLISPGGTSENLFAYVPAQIADTERGEAIRRGLIVSDTSAWAADAPLWVDFATGQLVDTQSTTTGFAPIARVVTSGSPGLLAFDPSAMETGADAMKPGEMNLLDNQAAPVDVGAPFIWDDDPASGPFAYVIEYGIRRPDSEFSEVGRMMISLDHNNDVGQVSVQRLATAGGTGVAFSMTYNGGDATFRLQYTSTNTGVAPRLRWRFVTDFV